MYYACLDGGKVTGVLQSNAPQGLPWVRVTEEEFMALGGIPTPDPVTAEQLQQENKLLKAQVQAMGNQYQFLEDCIAEMAAQVY